MTGLLLKLFTKGRKDAHFAAGKLAGLVGIICNLMLTALKLAAGLAAGSLSVIADAVNSLSDAASSAVTLLGFALAQRPADKDHPFGHARYEYLAGTVTAALILIIGVRLAISSVIKIIHPEPLNATALTVAVLVVSAALKIWLSLFYKKVGKTISSSALAAASADSRNDVLSTAAVLLGCILNLAANVNVDAYIGLAVAAFIIISGFRIVGDTVSPLIGKRADSELSEKLKSLILSRDGVIGVHDLLVHDYGPGQCYASAHAEIGVSMDAIACHEIIDAAEREALQKLNVHLVIHYDPVDESDAEQNRLREEVSALLKDIDGRIAIHDFRLTGDGEGERKKVRFDISLPYDLTRRRDEIKSGITSALADYDVSINFDCGEE